MVIQTLERGFTVIRVIKDTEDVDVFLCRDMLLDTEDFYVILCLKNPELIYRTLPFFASQKNNSAFDDFIECFSQDGKFYAVFKHHDKKPLLAKVESGELLLLEKLDIAKNIISKMSLQNMPPCIQYEVLHWDNLMVDDSLAVYFKYALDEVSMYNLINFQLVQTELAGILRTLFDKEIVTKISMELIDFIDNLEAGMFSKYIEIYSAYDNVYKLMRNMLEAGEVEPQNFLFRLWSRVKKVASYAKPVIAILVVAVAFGFLLHTLTNPPAKAAPTASGVYIDQIGTVKVE